MATRAGGLVTHPTAGRLGNVSRQFENEMTNLLHMFDMPSTIATRPDWGLAVDIQEDGNKFVLSADVPGLDKRDVKVTLSPDNMLSISGERKMEKEEQRGGNVHYVERSYGKFQRRFRLPNNVDVKGISAKQENGVLTLTIPKLEKEEVKGRDITVE